MQLGVERVRLTGGEPLLRKDLPVLVGMLKDLGLSDLSLTTNGVLLERYADDLFSAGLDRITVSLDALRPTVFQAMSGRDDLDKVLRGLDKVAHRPGLKLDSVLVAGINDEELLPLLSYAGEIGAEIRFIEYMDVGGATNWSMQQVVSQEQILKRISRVYGPVQALPGRGSAPAQRFQAGSSPIFGIVASVTQPFCRACDRVRLTADGKVLTCLYAKMGKDLRLLLRGGASDSDILEKLAVLWAARSDRGAEDRFGLLERKALADKEELQENIHLEMHTRGG